MPDMHSEINRRCNRERASQQSHRQSTKQRVQYAGALIRLSRAVQIIIRDDAHHASVQYLIAYSLRLLDPERESGWEQHECSRRAVWRLWARRLNSMIFMVRCSSVIITDTVAWPGTIDRGYFYCAAWLEGLDNDYNTCIILKGFSCCPLPCTRSGSEAAVRLSNFPSYSKKHLH